MNHDNYDMQMLKAVQSIAKSLEKMVKHEKEKLNCTNCILDNTDACTRGSGRAVDDEICKEFMEGE